MRTAWIFEGHFWKSKARKNQIGKSGQDFKHPQKLWLERKSQTASAGKNAKRREPLCTVGGGNGAGGATSVELPQRAEKQNDPVMTTEEIRNLNADRKKDIDIVVTDSNGDHSQDTRKRRRPRRAAMEELGKISKSKAVSLETKVSTIIHVLAFPVPEPGCKSWREKKADRKIPVHLKRGAGGEIHRCRHCPRDK